MKKWRLEYHRFWVNFHFRIAHKVHPAPDSELQYFYHIFRMYKHADRYIKLGGDVVDVYDD